MRLFEFEAKDVLSKYGLATPRGKTARSPDEAVAIAGEIGKPVVLKAQVLVSSRGKSGGIVFAGDAAGVKKAASSLLGSAIQGAKVGSLLIEEKLDITGQFYASVALDRQAKAYVVLASTSGGIDIEQIALATPDRISRYWVDPAVGFNQSTAVLMLARFSDITQQDASEFAAIIDTLYGIAMDCDAELVEINPLAKTAGGEFVAADARIIVDDNALFRHPEFKARSSERLDDTPLEAESRRLGLAYVDLPGDIGIIGNGAGLVMATVDLVHLFGGRPANFLDIGGGARTEVIKNGVKLVISKPEVRAVLINILGGITRCDLVARGIIEGLEESEVKKPVAVRLMGTNEAEGIRLLQQAGIHTYSSMEEAAREILTPQVGR